MCKDTMEICFFSLVICTDTFYLWFSNSEIWSACANIYLTVSYNIVINYDTNKQQGMSL